MKIIYKLEIHYFGNDENGCKIDRNDSFIYNNENSLKNREKVINDYNNFLDIFNDATKYGKLKLDWSEIIYKNIKEFHIPTMNIYYAENEISDENEIVLFGNLLESFEERMTELVDEVSIYEKNNIPFEYETITSINNENFRVIKNSLISENDKKLIKNVC